MFDWLKHFIDGLVHQTPVQRLAVLHGAMQDAAAAAQVLATPEVMSILPPEAKATVMAVSAVANEVEALHKTVQQAQSVMPAAEAVAGAAVTEVVSAAEAQAKAAADKAVADAEAKAQAKALADAEAAKLAADTPPPAGA